MQKSSWLKRLWGVIISPKATFDEWPEKVSFWPPALFLLGINLILALAVLPKGKEAALMALEKNAASYDPAQLAAAEEMVNITLPAMTVLGSLLIPLIIWLVVAGALVLAGRIFNLKLEFRRVLPLVVASWVPAFLGGILQTVLSLLTPVEAAARARVSLAALLPVTTDPSLAYLLLDKLNPFIIWTVVLLGLGTAAMAKVEKKQAMVMVFSLWLVYVVLSLAFNMPVRG